MLAALCGPIAPRLGQSGCVWVRGGPRTRGVALHGPRGDAVVPRSPLQRPFTVDAGRGKKRSRGVEDPSPEPYAMRQRGVIAID